MGESASKVVIEKAEINNLSANRTVHLSLSLSLSRVRGRREEVTFALSLSLSHVRGRRDVALATQGVESNGRVCL